MRFPSSVAALEGLRSTTVSRSVLRRPSPALRSL